jgi:hypothetical protein
MWRGEDELGRAMTVRKDEPELARLLLARIALPKRRKLVRSTQLDDLIQLLSAIIDPVRPLWSAEVELLFMCDPADPDLLQDMEGHTCPGEGARVWQLFSLVVNQKRTGFWRAFRRRLGNNCQELSKALFGFPQWRETTDRVQIETLAEFAKMNGRTRTLSRPFGMEKPSDLQWDPGSPVPALA